MKAFFLIASASLLLASCNQGMVDRANHRSDSLMSVLKERNSDLASRESSINEFITSFNEIERNLDSVAKRQQIIYLNADKVRGDIKSSQKDRINTHIHAINSLMSENRKQISELTKKLKGSSKVNNKLRETIKTLNDQLAQKDLELAALNEKLSALNTQVAQLQTSVDTLNTQLNAKSQTIAENTMAMHTAYYVVGRSKDLKAAKVIDRKGGLLGIGKTSRLSNNFDNSKFTRIDYTQMSSIPVNSNHVKIITAHPGDSYKLDRDPKNKNVVKALVITNPEKFWSASKYLVIEGNPVSTDNALSTNQRQKEKQL
jgi:septal ring factor EnvC (AmiA/AmiB activator)